MSIKFDRLELLELFDNEEIIDVNKAVYRYFLYYDDDFTLQLDVSTLDEIVIVQLAKKELEYPLLYFSFNCIRELCIFLSYDPSINGYLRLVDNRWKSLLIRMRPYVEIKSEDSIIDSRFYD